MGTRVNYELIGDEGTQPSVVFFSNSHHETEDPQVLFAKLAKKTVGVRGLVTMLMAATYKTTDRGHRAGDLVFAIDLYRGDREVVMKAIFGNSASPRVTTEKAVAPAPSMEEALEKLLRETKADQGGECTFEEWLQATAEDPAESMHEEALVLSKYRTRGVYAEEGEEATEA